MDNTLLIIKRLVKERGLPAVAVMLGHRDTQRISRWIKDNGIPQLHIKGIRAILAQEGEL